MSKAAEHVRQYAVTLAYSLEDESWIARFPDLPGCVADGETPTEALTNAETAKRLWLETAEELGRDLPSPTFDEDEDYSGRFVVRMPKSLHRNLANRAKREGTSLNQLVVTILAAGATARDVANLVITKIDTAFDRIQRALTDVFTEARATGVEKGYVFLDAFNEYSGQRISGSLPVFDLFSHPMPFEPFRRYNHPTAVRGEGTQA